MTTSPIHRLSPRGAVAIAAILVYAWVASGFRAFTWRENVAVALPVLVILAVVVRTWGRTPSPAGQDSAHAAGRRRAGAVWVGLVTLLVTWELIAYFSSPRHDHPTLSTIADDIMSHHPGRAAMFAMWLTLGWLLFVRSPARRP